MPFYLPSFMLLCSTAYFFLTFISLELGSMVRLRAMEQLLPDGDGCFRLGVGFMPSMSTSGACLHLHAVKGIWEFGLSDTWRNLTTRLGLCTQHHSPGKLLGMLELEGNLLCSPKGSREPGTNISSRRYIFGIFTHNLWPADRALITILCYHNQQVYLVLLLF